jgi:uncharacterized integral membrane protein
MKKEYKISLVLVILPLILFALPLLIQYVNNKDVGVFYFYGLNDLIIIVAQSALITGTIISLILMKLHCMFLE